MDNAGDRGPFKQVVLSLSGGMDSTSLMLHYLAQGYDVTALSFDYGQKHFIELACAEDCVDHLNLHGHRAFHHVIVLDGLGDLLDSALVAGGPDVPEGHYEEDNMKATVVPNRNKIFSSIIQSVALSVAQKTGQNVEIALGIHAGDHAIYPDCRKEFRDADHRAFQVGNWGSEKVTMATPYLNMTKFEILQEAKMNCRILALDFDEVFRNTNTSYKPILHGDTWYSDYKSASSVERIEAFIKLGRPDPVLYADEAGPVSWQTAKSHVQAILAQHTA